MAGILYRFTQLSTPMVMQSLVLQIKALIIGLMAMTIKEEYKYHDLTLTR